MKPNAKRKLRQLAPLRLGGEDALQILRERILADGKVERPLDHASLRHALDQAIALKAEGIVLALLHSYRNPAHEREAQKLIAEWAPGMPVFCSSDVWAIIREYEQEEFLWRSQTLGEIKLSARRADNAELERFFLRDFFGVAERDR